MLVVLVVTICWVCVGGTTNLVKNPSFEEELGEEWINKRFSMERYSENDVNELFSLRCTNRQKNSSGPAQRLPQLKPGRGYELRAKVKLLNSNPDKLFQSLKATVQFDFVGKNKDENDNTQPAKGKPKSCKGTKGEERKQCKARRKKWKAAQKKKKEEEKRRKKERKRKQKEKEKRKKAEQRRKDKEKKRREKEKAKLKKNKNKEKSKKEKEREKRKREKERLKKERAREKERLRKERRKNKSESDIEGNRVVRDTSGLDLSPRQSERDQEMSPSSVKRRELSPSLARQRRARRERRQDNANVPDAAGKSASAPDNDQELASGTSERAGTYIIAWRSWVTPEQGWVTLVGNINAPMRPFTTSTLQIKGPDPGVDFLLDNVTFYEIPERVDWRAESADMIDRYRKSNIYLKVDVPPGVNRQDVDIQVRLISHQFAFGSKVEDDLMRDEKKKYEPFRKLFFYLFNWATIGSFKWRFDKGRSLYSPDFSNALEALEVLRRNGIKVRAHSILWGVEKNIPEAVLQTKPEELSRLLSFRTQYVMNITRGQVEQVDVLNELLHGHWYEETMRDPNISETVFREARRLDPNVKLYLNDFTAVTSGANTEDLHDTAMRFIRAGTGIQGIGIQGHVKDFVRPDPTMIWRRLDRLAETGLELFMTEFDLGWDDEVERADWFEDAMRAFFAHPGLSGVILWGFWKERQRYQNKYLVYGDDLKFAEPGERYVCLVKKEWKTDETFNVARTSSFTVRGFYGDYEVLVKKRGIPVQRETFTHGKPTELVTINVTESETSIEIEEEPDYVPQCISHRDRKSLGKTNSTTSDTQLTCVDVEVSVASTDQRQIVVCPAGTMMTGCSSHHMLRSSRDWRGERMAYGNGAYCIAEDPTRRREIRITARCCRQAGLKCDYRQAGPSSPIEGAMAEAVCPPAHRALGCFASSLYSFVDGAFHGNGSMRSCRAQNGPSHSSRVSLQSGVVSGAACCRSPGLRCHLVTSAPGSPVVTAQCPPGDVMTSCQVQAQTGRAAGSWLETNSQVSTCRAFAARDAVQSTVIAIATCCRGTPTASKE